MRRPAIRIGLILGTLSILSTCILSTPAVAQSFGGAQTNRGGGTGGAFGGGGSGTGATGGFGAGGFGGGSFGSGGFGGFGGQGGTTGGGGAFGGGGGAAGVSGFAAQGANQFLLGNQATGGFVGREGGDIQQFFGGGTGNQAGNQGLQQFQNQARRQQFQNQANNANRGRGGGRGGDQGTPVRIALRVGFTPPRPLTAGLNDRLQTQVSRTLSSRVGVTNPTLDLTGQTVTLRGTVANVDQKLLAEEILSLQPGVTTVMNELVVVPQLPPPVAE